MAKGHGDHLEILVYINYIPSKNTFWIQGTVATYNQQNKAELREQQADAKYKSKNLRAKKTRAIRRRLTKDQKYQRVEAQPITDKSGRASQKYVLRAVPRVLKRRANFPTRVYAVKA